MARADIMAANARATMATWGETIYINGDPQTAIVEREVQRLDDYGKVISRYVEICVFVDTANNWGAAPALVIDGKNYRLGPEIDRNTLARFEVVPT